MTGIVGSLIQWTELFENIFSSEVSGIDIVLETQTRAHTYSVVEGVAVNV